MIQTPQSDILIKATTIIVGLGITYFLSRSYKKIRQKENSNHDKSKKLKIIKKKDSTPVLLITDIGADIDDTFALLTSLGSKHTHLVGVVTAVNDGRIRGSIISGWLRRAGYDDDEIPILPSVDPSVAGCVVPEGFPSVQESALGDVKDTPSRILEIAAAYAHELIIVAVAPVTPLAHALLIDEKGHLSRIQRIYFQGNVMVDPRTKVLKPDVQAYNFRIHMGAAERVFEELQHDVPFTFLGKFAAYAVGVTRRELEQVDASISSTSTSSCSTSTSASTRSTSKLPCLALMAKEQMNKFRHGNYELWCKLYPVPIQYNDLNKMEWYDHLPNDVISHPYDPLLLLLVAEDCMKLHSNKWLSSQQNDAQNDAQNTNPPPSSSSSQNNIINHNKNHMIDENDESGSFYQKECVGVMRTGGRKHFAVGNTPQECGVKDVPALKRALLGIISKGLHKCS